MPRLFLLLAAVAAFGQTAQTPSTSSNAQAGSSSQTTTGSASSRTTSGSSSNPDALKVHYGVRRFSIGATLSVQILKPIADRTTSDVQTNIAVPIDAIYDTTGAFRRIGFGATGQIMLTNHFGVAAELLMARASYVMNSDVFTGVDKPNTAADERTHTVRSEDTRARFYDLPVMLRWYNKSRKVGGVRFFAEGGASWRRVSNIKSTIDTNINSGTTTTSTSPITPKNRTVLGYTAGLGILAIDPIGIRVIPEVRYTRWSADTFNSFSTISARNQLEAGISLSF